MTDQADNQDDSSLFTHLIELRDRLLRSVLVILALLIPLFYFGNDLYTFVAEPLLRHMPQGTHMIATEVASPFLTPFKLALIAAVFLAVPYLLYQAWAFIAPGLYQHERRLALPLVVSSTVLFYAGIAFAYYVVFPLVFGFFIGVAPEGVEVMTDISKYLDFVLKLFIAFGIAFEVPIATILMCWTGMTTPDKLAAKRPYIIVGAFVIGMLMTPPDVISQTLLALPMWFLFELGIFFARRMPTRGEQAGDDGDEDELEPSIASPAQQAAAATAATTASAEADEEPYVAPSEDEMEAELDRIEAEEAAGDTDGSSGEDETAPGDRPKRD